MGAIDRGWIFRSEIFFLILGSIVFCWDFYLRFVKVCRHFNFNYLYHSRFIRFIEVVDYRSSLGLMESWDFTTKKDFILAVISNFKHNYMLIITVLFVINYNSLLFLNYI